MSGDVLRRPDEWCRLKGVRVLDPDGWRSDNAPSWVEPISEAEFNDRLSISTQGPWDWATDRPAARPAAGDTRTDRERVREALELIARGGCEIYTGDHRCSDPAVGRIRDSRYMSESWCPPCIAADALRALDGQP